MVIAVVGKGCGGLPLRVEFSNLQCFIGFDVDANEVAQCRVGTDPSKEITNERLRQALHATCTDDVRGLREAGLVVVPVPTPADDACIPDFGPFIGDISASLKTGALMAYESTVHYCATGEICISALEPTAGQRWKQNFRVGYKQESTNPGDRPLTVDKVAALNERTVPPARAAARASNPPRRAN